MTPLQTFRNVRPPTLLGLWSALSVWTAWWLCDQFQPTIGGLVLVPVAIAMLVKALFGLAMLRRQATRQMASHSDPGLIRILAVSTGAIVFCAACLPIFLQDGRLAQLGYTVCLVALGLGHYAFACFSPDDIKASQPDSNKTLGEMVGLYSIYGLSLIGLALISMALIKWAPDAIWVFAMSIGALFYLYLVRWVSVLWLLTRRDIPQ